MYALQRSSNPPSAPSAGFSFHIYFLHTVSLIFIILFVTFLALYLSLRFNPPSSTCGSLVDAANVNFYQIANSQVTSPPFAVFLGDSLTANWVNDNKLSVLHGGDFIGRGIGGQTAPQLLLRTLPDVVALRPKWMFLLGGINDLQISVGDNPWVLENLQAAGSVAMANNISVVFCSILPLGTAYRQGTDFPTRILQLNSGIRQFANLYPTAYYLDYWPYLIDHTNPSILNGSLTVDGLHVNDAGYDLMNEAVNDFIAQHPDLF